MRKRTAMAVFLTFLVGVCIAATEITRTTELSAISMNYDELAVLIDNLHGQLAKANGDPKDKYNRETVSLSVSAGEDTVSVSGWEPVTGIKGLPNPGRSANFRYMRYGASVSTIEISLTDYSRKISITGNDSSQVNAIYAFVRTQLDKNEILIGGSNFRLWGGNALWISAYLLLYIGLQEKPKPKKVLVVSGIAIASSIFILPWASWLSGFSVYGGTSGFLDRNINAISLFGLVVTLAIPLLGWLMRKRGDSAET